jgi:hypothetical protein
VSLEYTAGNDAGVASVRLAGGRKERRAEHNCSAQDREPESCSHESLRG